MKIQMLDKLKSELYRARLVVFAVFAFCMGAVFAFLAASNIDDTSATTAGFKAGNIITDYVMSNSNTMSVADIQNFLSRKNPCDYRDYNKYVSLMNSNAAKKGYSWHWENGHFVCLSEERFDGQSAAQIIYDAAQDFHINPQVLIVLLEKEQGLITDKYPNNIQYRSATGYGCPDTAACDTKYYGFKNQVRNAASLFHQVLTGGWSNYHVGNNQVAYHPNGACGSSTVYIENLATAALYRYTPYQPNSAALNWNGDGCSSYGNRNFYHYFTEWFGSTQKDPWTNMDNPRMMVVKKATNYDSVIQGNTTDETLPAGSILFFTIKASTNNGQCLGVARNQNKCIPLKDLEDVVAPNWTSLSTPRTMYIPKSSYAIDYSRGIATKTSEERLFIYFTEKIVFASGDSCMRGLDGEICYLLSDSQELELSQRQPMNDKRVMFAKEQLKTVTLKSQDSSVTTIQQDQPILYSSKYILNYSIQCLSNEDLDRQGQCVLYDSLYETPEFVGMNTPRDLFVPAGVTYYDFGNNTTTSTASAQNYKFAKKITIAGEDYVQLASDNGTKKCFRFKDLLESINIDKILTERDLFVPKNTKYYDFANNTNSFTDSDRALHFTKRATINGQLYIQSNQDDGTYRLYLFNDLREVPQFTSMDTSRTMYINQDSRYLDALTNTPSETITARSEYFQFKTYVSGNMCLATNNDIKQYRCVMYSDLTEKK